MALADLAALHALIATPDQRNTQVKTFNAGVGKSIKYMSTWAQGPQHLGVAPTAAAAVSSATAGAWPKVDAASGRQILLGGDYRVVVNTDSSGGGYTAHPLLIVDRLSHQGGLSGSDITLQTSNFPTAALTRYTSGVGVMMALETYAAIGTTATRLDATYTNSAGTGSRVGSLNTTTSELNAIGLFIPIPLQAGDLGVKSVESVQFTVSTGTAGNWGITLFRPVAFGWVYDDGRFDIMSNTLWNEEIIDGACLQVIPFGLTGSATVFHGLTLAEV